MDNLVPPHAKSPATAQACRQPFSGECPSRLLFEQIADKLSVLEPGPLRFNAIKRLIEGVTQKALTQCLRKLERNGLVQRRVLDTSPVQVEYAMTPLGHTLLLPFKALYGWTLDHLSEVDRARAAFDARHGG
jgi:DNA-binding HxlR family transcriptional regulator